MKAEDFFKQTEKEWQRIFYEQTAEEQADDFINKMQMTCSLLDQFRQPIVKRSKTKWVRRISRDELWGLWLVISELGELLRVRIEAGAKGLDELHKRKIKAQKMIQRYRVKMK